MLKKSVLIAGQHATSISLEEPFFAELQIIVSERNVSLNKLITEIDMERQEENLSSAIRVYVLNYLKQKSTAPK